MRLNPHINYMPIKPLSDDLYFKLLDIYNRAQTHSCTFKVVGFENSETIWTETKEDLEWICDNILPFYNLTLDDVVELVYTAEDLKNNEAKGRPIYDRTTWEFKNVPPWGPRSLNFTRLKANSFVGAHEDPEAACKINIPVLNMSASNIHFTNDNESFWYGTPALLNVNALHSVDNTDRIAHYSPAERVFFQVCLKKSFQHYMQTMPVPNGW